MTEMAGWAIIALDHRVVPDGRVAERVAYPGEDGGVPFRQWRDEWLADEE